jgi:hypothetical protein
MTFRPRANVTGAHSAFVGRELSIRPRLVEAIDEAQWKLV